MICKAKTIRMMFLIVAALLVFPRLSPAQVSADQDRPPQVSSRMSPQERVDMFLDGLGLTAEQKEQLKAIRDEYQKKVKGLRDQLREKEKALKTELNRETIDKAKVKALAAEVKKYTAQQVDIDVENTLGLRRILTFEQFESFREKVKKALTKRKDAQREHLEQMPGE